MLNFEFLMMRACEFSRNRDLSRGCELRVLFWNREDSEAVQETDL